MLSLEVQGATNAGEDQYLLAVIVSFCGLILWAVASLSLGVCFFWSLVQVAAIMAIQGISWGTRWWYFICCSVPGL